MPNWLRWLLSVALLCVMTAAWLLTTDYGIERERRNQRQIVAQKLTRVRAQLSRASRLAWTREQLAGRGNIVLQFRDSLPATFRDSIVAGIAAEFAPAPEPQVRLALLQLPPRFAATGLDREAEYYASTGVEAPWCAGLAPRGPSTRTSSRYTPFDEEVWTTEAGRAEYTPRRLGPCRLWARHGRPGPGVEAWLAATGGYFARGSTPLHALPREWRAAGAFGAPRRLERGLVLAPCQAGLLSACRTSLLAPSEYWLRPNVSPPGAVAMYADWFFSQGAAAGLLAAVEEEFGRERFARFWRSDADVATAFAQAFGVPIEVWTADWVQELMGRREAGPRLAASTLLLALVTLGLLAAAALQVARRRTIG